MAFSEGDHAIMNEIARKAAHETAIELRADMEKDIQLHAAQCPVAADMQKAKGAWKAIAAIAAAVGAGVGWVIAWVRG